MLDTKPATTSANSTPYSSLARYFRACDKSIQSPSAATRQIAPSPGVTYRRLCNRGLKLNRQAKPTAIIAQIEPQLRARGVGMALEFRGTPRAAIPAIERTNVRGLRRKRAK